MIHRMALCALALMVFAALAEAAESKVTLRNGREVVGEVKPDDDGGYWIETAAGRIHVDQADVASIEVLPERKPAESKSTESEKTSGEPTPGSDAAAQRKAENDAARADFSQKQRSKEEQLEYETMRFEILQGLGSKDTGKRAEAGKRLLEAWPETASILDAALSHKTESVRVEAVRLLESPLLGDPSARVERMFRDSSSTVQVLAVRVVRHRQLQKLEASLTFLLASVREWPVHQEVLRTLEEVGSTACLRTVLDRYAETKDARQRRAFVRVLKKITRADEGDDTEAWRTVVDRVLLSLDTPRR